ncbi:MAG: hypothetical protein Hals2KO_26740 [Halioglobus sp.]
MATCPRAFIPTTGSSAARQHIAIAQLAHHKVRFAPRPGVSRHAAGGTAVTHRTGYRVYGRCKPTGRYILVALNRAQRTEGQDGAAQDTREVISYMECTEGPAKGVM